MTTTITPPTEQRITELNDLCRQAMGVMGRVFQTQRHSALPPSAQSAIREKVELFDDFTEDNDPHGEHDFGAFEHEGERKSATTPPTWNTQREPRRSATDGQGFNDHAGQRVLTAEPPRRAIGGASLQ